MSQSQSQSQSQAQAQAPKKTFRMTINGISCEKLADAAAPDIRVDVPADRLDAETAAGCIARTHGFAVASTDVAFVNREGLTAPPDEATHLHLPKQYARPYTEAWMRRTTRDLLIQHERDVGAGRASEIYREFLAGAKTDE